MLREESSAQAGIMMSEMATGKPKSMTTKWRETGSSRSTTRCCRGWKAKRELKMEKSTECAAGREGWSGG